MSNGGVVPSRFPVVPPFYAKDRRVAPGTAAQARSLTAEAKARAHGEEMTKNYFSDEFLRKKKIVKGFFYTPDAVPLTLPASGTLTAIITLNKEAAFQWDKLSCSVDIPALGQFGVRGDDFTFRIRDDRKQMYLSNSPLHNLAATGSGIFPLLLPDTKFFDPSTTISIEMTNRRAVALNVNWVFGGSNYYTREFENLTRTPNFAGLSRQEKEFFLTKQKKYVEPYFYTFDNGILTLNAGATLTDQIISIRQEADFEMFALMVFSEAPFRFTIRESNTGRFITNQQVHSTVALGDGERPYVLPSPYWLDSNSQLLVTMVNLDANNANDVQIVALGRNWYDSASLQLLAGASFFYDKYDQGC